MHAISFMEENKRNKPIPRSGIRLSHIIIMEKSICFRTFRFHCRATYNVYHLWTIGTIEIIAFWNENDDTKSDWPNTQSPVLPSIMVSSLLESCLKNESQLRIQWPSLYVDIKQICTRFIYTIISNVMFIFVYLLFAMEYRGGDRCYFCLTWEMASL